MLLSTQTEIMGQRFGEEKAVRILAEAGFDALDYSMFSLHQDDHVLNKPGYASYLARLRRTAEDLGLIFNQAHAPFPTHIPGDEAYNTAIFSRVVRAMEAAALLGAGLIVVHPTDFFDPAVNKQRNIEIYQKLQPYAREFQIKVCLENLWGWNGKQDQIIPNVCSTGEDFADYLDALDPDFFTGCLDLGHCGLVGKKAADMIRILGPDRLLALHVHDNDHLHDTHTLPYLGLIDWPAVTAALKEIGYRGDLTLEADFFLSRIPDSLLPEASRFMHNVGRQLIAMIE